jgi:hypothetical protein
MGITGRMILCPDRIRNAADPDDFVRIQIRLKNSSGSLRHFFGSGSGPNIRIRPKKAESGWLRIRNTITKENIIRSPSFLFVNGKYDKIQEMIGVFLMDTAGASESSHPCGSGHDTGY